MATPEMDRGVEELGEGVGVAVADNPGPLTLDGTRSYRIGSRRAVLLDPGPDRPGGLRRLFRLVGEATDMLRGKNPVREQMPEREGFDEVNRRTVEAYKNMK